MLPPAAEAIDILKPLLVDEEMLEAPHALLSGVMQREGDCAHTDAAELVLPCALCAGAHDPAAQIAPWTTQISHRLILLRRW